MKRLGLGTLVLGVILFHGGFARAQSSIDVLDQELKEAQQARLDVASQAMQSFFSQIDAAMASPDAAVALYQQAGGALPDPNPVVSEHENETPTEKGVRLAKDQANLARLGAVLQLHCGLMHYAALFVVKPDQKGLKDDWAAWLKTAAQNYPQLAMPVSADGAAPDPHPRKKNKDGTAPVIFDPSDLKGKSMRESLIGKYLGFRGWADKEQGGWSVANMPALYRANVLEPLRTTPTADTLAAWDVYIAMANADEKDNDKWNQVVYPPLQFDRGSDACAIAPSTEKIEGLVNIVKANPTHAKVDEWITRLHQMIADYRAHHGGGGVAAPSPATAPASPPMNPNVTVTTTVQGDMTIVTTHTNTAPVNPGAPSAPK